MAGEVRERMVEGAMALLARQGLDATSFSEVLAATGAPRGSLYHHFPGGKDELAIEATRAAVDEATEALRDALAKAKNPARGVRAYLEAAAHLLRETDYTFGCPVAPVILDAAGGVAELAELCRQAFETWAGMMRAAFVAAGLPGKRAQALALLVMSSIEGLLLIARANRDCSALATVAAELERVVAADLPRRRRAA